jgi:hypothetical protein
LTAVKRGLDATRMLAVVFCHSSVCGGTATRRRRPAKMPWNETYFPASMRHLSPPVRAKAIEIANALLEEGMDEGRAIRIAIAKAKQWAAQRGLPLRG